MKHSNQSEHRQDGTEHAMHKGHREAGPENGDHTGHHAHMAADFRKRFWISLVITLPILFLSPMLQVLVDCGEPSDSQARSRRSLGSKHRRP